MLHVVSFFVRRFILGLGRSMSPLLEYEKARTSAMRRMRGAALNIWQAAGLSFPKAVWMWLDPGGASQRRRAPEVVPILWSCRWRRNRCKHGALAPVRAGPPARSALLRVRARRVQEAWREGLWALASWAGNGEVAEPGGRSSQR